MENKDTVLRAFRHRKDRETRIVVQQHLRGAGCRYSFKFKRWECPGCGDLSLRLPLEQDGAVRLRCARRCPELALQRMIGVTGLDIGPLHLRPEFA